MPGSQPTPPCPVQMGSAPRGNQHAIIKATQQVTSNKTKPDIYGHRGQSLRGWEVPDFCTHRRQAPSARPALKEVAMDRGHCLSHLQVPRPSGW